MEEDDRARESADDGPGAGQRKEKGKAPAPASPSSPVTPARLGVFNRIGRAWKTMGKPNDITTDVAEAGGSGTQANDGGGESTPGTPSLLGAQGVRAGEPPSSSGAGEEIQGPPAPAPSPSPAAAAAASDSETEAERRQRRQRSSRPLDPADRERTPPAERARRIEEQYRDMGFRLLAPERATVHADQAAMDGWLEALRRRLARPGGADPTRAEFRRLLHEYDELFDDALRGAATSAARAHVVYEDLLRQNQALAGDGAGRGGAGPLGAAKSNDDDDDDDDDDGSWEEVTLSQRERELEQMRLECETEKKQVAEDRDKLQALLTVGDEEAQNQAKKMAQLQQAMTANTVLFSQGETERDQLVEMLDEAREKLERINDKNSDGDAGAAPDNVAEAQALQGQVMQLQQVILARDTLMTQRQADLDKARAELGRVETAYSTQGSVLATQDAEIVRLVDNLKDRDREIKDVRIELEGSAKCEAKVLELQNEVIGLQDDLLKRIQQVAEREEARDRAAKDMAEANEARRQRSQMLSQVNTEKLQLIEHIEKLKDQLRGYEKGTEAASDAEVQQLRDRIRDLEEATINRDQRLADAEVERDRAFQELDALKAELAQLRKEHDKDKADEKEGSAGDDETRRTARKNRIESIKQEIERLQAKYLSAAKVATSRQTEVETVDQQVKTLEAELARLMEGEDVDVDEQLRKGFQAEIRELRRQRAKLEEDVVVYRAKAAEIQAFLDRDTTRAKELDALCAKQEKQSKEDKDRIAELEKQMQKSRRDVDRLNTELLHAERELSRRRTTRASQSQPSPVGLNLTERDRELLEQRIRAEVDSEKVVLEGLNANLESAYDSLLRQNHMDDESIRRFFKKQRKDLARDLRNRFSREKEHLLGQLESTINEHDMMMEESAARRRIVVQEEMQALTLAHQEAMDAAQQRFDREYERLRGEWTEEYTRQAAEHHQKVNRLESQIREEKAARIPANMTEEEGIKILKNLVDKLQVEVDTCRVHEAATRNQARQLQEDNAKLKKEVADLKRAATQATPSPGSVAQRLELENRIEELEDSSREASRKMHNHQQRTKDYQRRNEKLKKRIADMEQQGISHSLNRRVTDLYVEMDNLNDERKRVEKNYENVVEELSNLKLEVDKRVELARQECKDQAGTTSLGPQRLRDIGRWDGSSDPEAPGWFDDAELLCAKLMKSLEDRDYYKMKWNGHHEFIEKFKNQLHGPQAAKKWEELDVVNMLDSDHVTLTIQTLHDYVENAENGSPPPPPSDELTRLWDWENFQCQLNFLLRFLIEARYPMAAWWASEMIQRVKAANMPRSCTAFILTLLRVVLNLHDPLDNSFRDINGMAEELKTAKRETFGENFELEAWEAAPEPWRTLVESVVGKAEDTLKNLPKLPWDMRFWDGKSYDCCGCWYTLRKCGDHTALSDGDTCEYKGYVVLKCWQHQDKFGPRERTNWVVTEKKAAD